MAKTDIYGEDDRVRDSEREGLQELRWAVAKSLLDANAHSTQAFEYYLMGTYRSDASLNLDSMQQCLWQAIDEHQKIIEELQVAAEIIEELKDDERA